MPPARLAHADLTTTPLALAGVGVVEVNGSGEMPARSGPPRPRSPDAVLSLARTALRDHLDHLGTLAADRERAARPTERLREQLVTAMAELAAAEQALANIDAEHAAEIAECARLGRGAPALPPSSDDAEAAVARGRRAANTLRMAVDECSRDQQTAAAALQAHESRGAELLLSVLVEDEARLRRDWFDAHEKAVAAELHLLSLHECIGEHGRTLESKTPGSGIVWLRALERMRERPPGAVAARELGPRDIMTGAAQWADMVERLKADPTASL